MPWKVKSPKTGAVRIIDSDEEADAYRAKGYEVTPAEEPQPEQAGTAPEAAASQAAQKKPWYNKNIPIIDMPLVSEAGLWEDAKAALSPANLFKSAYPATDRVYKETENLPIAAQTAIRAPVAAAETALNVFPLTSPTTPAGKALRTGLDIAGKPLNMAAKSLEGIAGKTPPQAIKSRLGEKIDAAGKKVAAAVSDKPIKVENLRNDIAALKAEANHIGRTPKTPEQAKRLGIIQDEIATLENIKSGLKPVKFDFDKLLLAREAAAREAAFLAGKSGSDYFLDRYIQNSAPDSLATGR